MLEVLTCHQKLEGASKLSSLRYDKPVSSFIGESFGHTATAGHSILSYLSSEEVLIKGFVFRVSSLVDSCLLKAVDEGIPNFVTKLEKSLGIQGILSPLYRLFKPDDNLD